ncbi:topoisomerase DNA-binding C4 zinc finger domain-containing protein [Treponema pedis]|uniref:topoisomerase DNA-binding C4 zinc finger domain-containing protein n=1 Tax=Treponema pedis TaxID=409322 RepID=UPI0004002E8A|nr:topoisomerase DNA-binding C4 zinc finger domain-containing protein [Treponema pedis]
MPVIYDSDLLNLIYSDTTNKCLTEIEIHKIVDLLSSKNIVDEETRIEHIKNIKQTVVERELKTENLICPRYNGELKLREGKSGKFYGCSNYPRCRFTMPC